MSEEKAEQGLNANAPVKSVTLDLTAIEQVAMIGTSTGVAIGPRIIAQGKCPGRGCGATANQGRGEVMNATLFAQKQAANRFWWSERIRTCIMRTAPPIRQRSVKST